MTIEHLDGRGEICELLESWLEKAQNGELLGCAVVVDMPNGFGFGCSTSRKGEVASLVVALEVAKNRLITTNYGVSPN